MKIRIAFPLIGGGAWTGGYVYLRNTLSIIQNQLSDEIEATVFLSESELKSLGNELRPLVGGRLIVDAGKARAGSGTRLVGALATGRDARLARLLKRSRIDVAFEVGQFYGSRFPIPLISWMPDFQHRTMPEMFSPLNWWRREMGFRTQIRSGRTIMLSSETAREDFERYYSGAVGQARVVPFAIELDIASVMARSEEVKKRYQLPERFFFLPNQFWRHKNHDVVIAALRDLKAKGCLDQIPPVILSGLSKGQSGTTEHFDALLAQVRDAGIESHFRYLGLIPYTDVLSLNATCDALINPSRFEGWSTPIEEAKALGTPLVLAEIPIHREQAPSARFIDPVSGPGLARTLFNLAEGPRHIRLPLSNLVTAHKLRLKTHAQSLLETVRYAVARVD